MLALKPAGRFIDGIYGGIVHCGLGNHNIIVFIATSLDKHRILLAYFLFQFKISHKNNFKNPCAVLPSSAGSQSTRVMTENFQETVNNLDY